MKSRRYSQRMAFMTSVFAIALGAAGFWVLVTIPRETTVFLIEEGPVRWLTGGLWLTVAFLAVRYARGIGRYWKHGLVFMGMGAILLLGTVIMDRVQKSMRDRGPNGDRYVLGIAEESMEIIVPVLFILALLQIGTHIRESKTKPGSAGGDRIET